MPACDVAYEIHPGEDIFDCATFERFLEALKGHKRCNILYDPSHFVLQQLDYLDYIDIYHERIKAFHVKDAEFNRTGRQGVYSGYAPWVERAGRFRSLGDGQVDFSGIFSKLAQYGYASWAVLEWECCLKHRGRRREGAEFIEPHIIRVTKKGSTISPAARSTSSRSRARSASLGEADGHRRTKRREKGAANCIRLGMVGGGEGAFIGAVHRIASRIDDQYELVAGALSSTPEKARRSGEALGLATASTTTMRAWRRRRRSARTRLRRSRSSRRTTCTRGPPIAFLKGDVHVICDKPLTVSLAEAKRMKAAVEKSGKIFALTHNYTGYPLVRRMREMARAGDLGVIRLVQVEYPQDWLTGPTEKSGNKQAEWRTDPKVLRRRAGRSATSAPTPSTSPTMWTGL